MDDDALRAEIGASVLRFIANVVLYNTAVSQRMGLGASDSQFLSLLMVHGPLTPGRLAELSGLTTGTVTGVLDRLERGEFVRRERDATDRRKVLVVLVPAAMSRFDEHYRGHGEHMARVLSTRGADELRAIAAFLADMNDSPA